MKISYPLIVFFCVSYCTFSQSKIDSLKADLKVGAAKDNKEYIGNYMAQIGYVFLSEGRYDSAIFYFLKSVNTANVSLAASSYNSLGVAYNSKGMPDSAIYYYGKALTLYNKQNDTTHALTIENNLAIIYKNQGFYEKALETAFDALDKLEKMPADRTLASSYNTVALVYTQMGDNVNALTYHEKALAIRMLIHFERGVAQSYNNIGETYINMHMYDSALSNLLRSLEIKKELGDQGAIGATLNLIGLVFMRLGKHGQAEIYLVEAVRIKREVGEALGEAVALNNLAELRLAVGDTRNAEAFLNRAESLIRQAEALDELQRNLELRVRFYKRLHDASRALKAMEELLIVKDSLLTKEKVQSLLTMQVRYETEKKEQQIELLEKEGDLQKARIKTRETWIWTLVIVVMLLSVIAGLVYKYFTAMRRNKEGVEILLKELHHRVKNYLQLLSGIFSLQSQELTDERAIQMVKTNEARINAIALIHRKLYNTDMNRSINIRDYILELVQYLIHAYGYNEKPFILSSEIKDVQVDVDKAIPLGLILNELISNSFKYAYEGTFSAGIEN